MSIWKRYTEEEKKSRPLDTGKKYLHPLDEIYKSPSVTIPFSRMPEILDFICENLPPVKKKP